ncbi:MAG TPA: GNAT family N-acetyltransferase [Candidatus Angelobacter sp.]|nr:GNAT family N-acetyltransferase [Candidatus Angelobacter sp.]
MRPRKKRERVVKAETRKFEVGDLDQVLTLAERYASWDATPTKADVEGFHSANPEFFFVAEVGKKIVGFVYGTESNPPAETLDRWKSRKVASIETLVVDEEYRRRGIGTSLVRVLFDVFKQKRIDLVTLSVPAVEKAAIKLYEKMGFEPRGYFLWKRLVK